jgi:hypothetical protein
LSKKKPTRADRWNEACAAARKAHTECVGKAQALEEELEKLTAAMSDLRAVQEEFEEWQGNLPESLQSTALGEKLEAVTGIRIDDYTATDLEHAADLFEIDSVLDEAEGADLPQGFGRD